MHFVRNSHMVFTSTCKGTWGAQFSAHTQNTSTGKPLGLRRKVMVKFKFITQIHHQLQHALGEERSNLFSG